jgi:hypothetical protein
LPLLFALTLFVSAALLFWVQPMFARMVLPYLGGTPAVWNTCVVFFQASLLAGYTYAHLTPAWLGVRRQALAHIGLMLVPLLLLPIAVPEALVPWLDSVHPAVGLLTLLLEGVGLPFFVVSTTAPLLQRWFAATGHPSAGDPYYLYAASNLGSMIALLAYPFVMEPWLHLLPADPYTGQPLLLSQPWLWTAGYALLLGLVLACAVQVWKAPHLPPEVQKGAEGKAPDGHEPVTPRRRLLWVLLAAVPSSLMLGATTFITTDVAPIPLLWVIPLALYLLTFILAFARRFRVSARAVDRVVPLVVLVMTIVLLSEATEPVWVVVGAHLLALFVLALFCHSLLAQLRPDTRYLTEFYFWLSLGGVLGGLFNALLAPLVFSRITEYPLAIVLACLLRLAVGSEQPAVGSKDKEWRNASAGSPSLPIARCPLPTATDLLLPLAVGILTVTLILTGRGFGVPAGPLSVAMMFAVPAVICYTFLERPWRFGLAVGALLLASTLYPGMHGDVVYQTRTFFGVHRVVEATDKAGQRYRGLIHGNTVHGQQRLDPTWRYEPLTYYTKTGPIGQLIAFLNTPPRGLATEAASIWAKAAGGPHAAMLAVLLQEHHGQLQLAKPPPRRLNRVAIVGLGAGSLAAYGKPGQAYTFFEIDPAVIYLARDSGYFTFLADSKAHFDIVEGDARLQLARTDKRFDLLVLDAFSSDALPVHLFTREALHIYLERLQDNGVLAFHISNRYLDMAPMLAELAHEAGLVCMGRESDDDPRLGQLASQWVAMGRASAGLAELQKLGWKVLAGGGQRPWTDDHADVLQLLKFGRH